MSLSEYVLRRLRQKRNPYRRWFDQLEPLLNAVGASYYDGSACHLDLVQWATDPKWGALSRSSRRMLLQQDIPFLAAQLEHENVRLLLLNGTAVIRNFRKAFCVDIEERTRLDDHGHTTTRILSGRLFDRILVVGWSTNIQRRSLGGNRRSVVVRGYERAPTRNRGRPGGTSF